MKRGEVCNWDDAVRSAPASPLVPAGGMETDSQPGVSTGCHLRELPCTFCVCYISCYYSRDRGKSENEAAQLRGQLDRLEGMLQQYAGAGNASSSSSSEATPMSLLPPYWKQLRESFLAYAALHSCLCPPPTEPD